MRCFIALEVGEEVKQLCHSYIDKLKKTSFSAKWVEEENFHITLFFLGEINEGQIKRTAEILRNIQIKPFSLLINKLGYFQKYHKPTSIWLGLKQCEALQQLYLKMKSEMEEIGHQPFKKNFIPHLTLGRIKKVPEDWKNKINSISVKNVTISDISISLENSTLTETGPIYKVLETKAL